MKTGARQDWTQARTYWETHASTDGTLDLDADPDALNNIGWPGAPLWLNQHLCALQVPPYDQLLALIPRRGVRPRALDVGCGSGRWSRKLAGDGYEVTGVDLQAALIEADRSRMPQIRFVVGSVQEFEDPDGFDLITAVCVIQHNPFDQQLEIVARLRELIVPGGHVLVLENIADPSHYVFARTVAGWTELYERSGFQLVATRPYDRSPLMRGVLRARDLAKAALRRGTGPSPAPGQPESAAAPAPSPALARGAHHALLRAATRLDLALERLPLGPATAHHCAFLFRAG